MDHLQTSLNVSPMDCAGDLTMSISSTTHSLRRELISSFQGSESVTTIWLIL